MTSRIRFRSSAAALALLAPIGCFSASGTENGGTDGATGTDETTASSSMDTSGGPTSADATTSSQSTSASTTNDSADTTTGGTDGSGGTTEAGDTIPPEVVSIDPEHGSVDVIDDPVTIEFSEAMDTASVEAAFPSATAFAWNNGETTVQIALPFPFEETPVLYDIVVPTSVTDLAGNALAEEVAATISLAAMLSTTLEYQSNLTGNVQEGSTTYYTFFFGGDNGDDAINYGAVSFPLGDLPDYGSILGLRSATFASQVISLSGDPNDPAQGGFVIDHVEFAAGSEISDPTVLEAAFDDLLAGGDLAAGDPISVDVTAQLQSSWSTDATHLQLRVHPAQASANATADRIFLRRAGDENDGIVDPAVDDPDASNRARLEVEYFVQ